MGNIEIIINIVVTIVTSLIAMYGVIKSNDVRTAKREITEKETTARIEEQLRTLFRLIKKLEIKQDETNEVKIRVAELETWRHEHEKHHELLEYTARKGIEK